MSLEVIELAAKAVSAVVAALLFATVIAAGVGVWLEERRRGYRLPYEQPSHVTVLRREDDQ